jgi:hypothetical protein
LFWFYFWRGLFVSNYHLRQEAGGNWSVSS